MTVRSVGAALLAGTLLFSFPHRAVADAGAEDLLAKHRAFAGWQLGDGTLQTLRLERDYRDSAGAVVVRTLERRAGLAYRDTNRNLGRDTVDERGFDGDVFWSSNWNGFTTPATGELAQFRLSEDAFFNEGLDRIPASLRGTATVDGKIVSIVRVAVPGGVPVDLYADPGTGAYVQAVIDPGGNYETTVHVLSYVEARAGEKIVGSYRLDRDGGTYAFVDPEPNVPLDDAQLRPPAPLAAWTFENPRPFPIAVTHDRFYVDATIDGVPGRFILDTGAAIIYLTSSFAAKAHFSTLWSTDNGKGSGAMLVRSDAVKLHALAIGGNTLSNVYARVNRSGFEGDPDAPDGLIGFDLFAGAIVTLDTDNGTMTLADPRRPVDSGNGIPVPVDLSSLQPQVLMKLNGSIPVKAMLDSGDPEYVLLARDLVSRYGLRMLVDNTQEGFLQSHLSIAGVGGSENDECGHIDSLQLGPIFYENSNACTSPSFQRRNVLVGFDFLKHFNLIFDYPHGRIVMFPHKEQ